MAELSPTTTGNIGPLKLVNDRESFQDVMAFTGPAPEVNSSTTLCTSSCTELQGFSAHHCLAAAEGQWQACNASVCCCSVWRVDDGQVSP